MATIAEIAAADELTDFLEKSGLELNERLRKELKVKFNDPFYNVLDIREYLFTELLTQTGYSAPLMNTFIRKSTGLSSKDEITFARSDSKEIYITANKIIKEVILTGDLSYVDRAGGAVSKHVLRQVDLTQDKYRPVANWERHLNFGACDWCQDEVFNFQATGVFKRHGNCRCTKVRS